MTISGRVCGFRAVPGDRGLTGAGCFLGWFLPMKDRLPGRLWVKLYLYMWFGHCMFVCSVSHPEKPSEHLWGDILSPRPALVALKEVGQPGGHPRGRTVTPTSAAGSPAELTVLAGHPVQPWPQPAEPRACLLPHWVPGGAQPACAAQLQDRAGCTAQDLRG